MNWRCKECGSDKKSTYDLLCDNCYQKKWRKTKPEKHREYITNYRKKNPEKRKAWSKIERGKSEVKIEGLCQICKERPARIRHHPDYRFPEWVVLVCHKCHKQIHSPQTQKATSVVEKRGRESVELQSRLSHKPVDTPSEQDSARGFHANGFPAPDKGSDCRKAQDCGKYLFNMGCFAVKCGMENHIGIYLCDSCKSRTKSK